jgi:O-antigen ligase
MDLISRPIRNYNSLFFAIVIFFVAALFGGATVILPWWLVVGMLLSPIMLAIALSFPLAGVIFILCSVYGIPPFGLIPALPFAGGGFTLADILLILLSFVCLIRLMYQPKAMSRNGLAIAMFGVVLVVVSAFNGHFLGGAPLKFVLQEVRPYLYWFVLLVLLQNIISRDRYIYFSNALVFVGVVLSLLITVQSFSGMQLLNSGRLMDVYTVTKSYEGVLRSTTPGIYLIIFSIFMVVLNFYDRTAHRAYLVLLLPLFSALAVSFGRGVWLSFLLCIFFIGVLKGRKFLKMAFFIVSMLIVFGSTLLVAFKPDAVSAFVDRIFSISDEVKYGSSLARRYQENYYALEAIKQNPVIGIGVGSQYKPQTRLDGFEGEERYIHNSYLFIAAKFGLIGLVFPVIVIFLVIGVLRNSKTIEDVRLRSVCVAAGVTALIPMLFTANTQPEWVKGSGILIMAIFVSIAIKSFQLSIVDPKNDGVGSGG